MGMLMLQDAPATLVESSGNLLRNTAVSEHNKQVLQGARRQADEETEKNGGETSNLAEEESSQPGVQVLEDQNHESNPAIETVRTKNLSAQGTLRRR